MVFTGIIQEKAKLVKVSRFEDFSQIEIETSPKFIDGIQIGASVSVDGVCLTVTSIDDNRLTFDIIVETLNVTTLSVENEELKKYTIKSIKADDPVWFGCDVGKFFTRPG